MQHSPRKFWEVWGRSDALYNRWAAAHGVNNYRLFVLYVLDNHPGATQKAISDHAGLPKQTVNTVSARCALRATSRSAPPAATAARRTPPSRPPGRPMPVSCSSRSMHSRTLSLPAWAMRACRR